MLKGGALVSNAMPGTVPGIFQETLAVPFSPGISPANTPHEGGFAQLTSQYTPLSKRLGRDLPPELHERMIKLSYLAWRTNPMAKRLIEMRVNFVLGSGITLSSPDVGTMKVLRDWWTNPYNNWPYNIHQRYRDLLIYGEWLQHPLVNSLGEVFIRDVQPDNIKAIEVELGNHSQAEFLILKKVVNPQTKEEKEELVVPIIRRRLDPKTLTLGQYTGSVFYFGINRTTDATRGIGELFPLIDYIDLYDEVLFRRAEKIVAMGSIYFDLKAEGLSEREMRDYLAKETSLPPKPGGVYMHNESFELNLKTPDLHADDHAEDVRTIKSHIVAGDGWPGTFFDDPGSAGRAVGAEMAEPALRMIITQQDMLREILRIEMDYVLEQAQKASSRVNNGEPFVPGEYTISFSRPSSRDLTRIGPAMARLSQFMAEPMTGLSPQEKRNIAVTQVNQLGLADVPLKMELPVVNTVLPEPEKDDPPEEDKPSKKEDEEAEEVVWRSERLL